MIFRSTHEDSISFMTIMGNIRIIITFYQYIVLSFFLHVETFSSRYQIAKVKPILAEDNFAYCTPYFCFKHRSIIHK